MKLKRVAVLCSNSRHFKDWVKINGFKKGIKPHFAIDVFNFVEYTAFYINEPLHRAQNKFIGIHFWSINDISIPDIQELSNYNEMLEILQQKVKRN